MAFSEIEWICIPAGEFLMGLSDQQIEYLLETVEPGRQSDIRTRLKERYGKLRQVWLDTFYIARFPITTHQFSVIGATLFEYTPDYVDPESSKANLPQYVSRYEAAEHFCEGIGARLPTSEEWEKAARGTEGCLFPWGNEWHPEWANVTKGERRTRIVGQKSSAVDAYPEGASPYGVYDMVGNGREWTSTPTSRYDNTGVIVRGSCADAFPPIRHVHSAFAAQRHLLYSASGKRKPYFPEMIVIRPVCDRPPKSV